MLADNIKAAQQGNRAALNSLLDAHKDLAFSIALRYIKNETDAEDIVQEAFIQVFRNIRKFRNEAAFSTWLYKIVYREALKYIGKRKAFVNLAAADNSFEEIEVFSEERHWALKKAMQCLNDNEYMVIHLFYLAEKDIKEIHAISDLSKANIKTLLHRGRKKLFHYFEENKHLKNSL